MDLGEPCQIHSNCDAPAYAESEGAVGRSYILSSKAQFSALARDMRVGKNARIHAHTQPNHQVWLNPYSAICLFFQGASEGDTWRYTISFLSHLPGLLVGQAQTMGSLQWLCP